MLGWTIQFTHETPIQPTDLVKQSLPFSYLALSAVSTDGDSHSVQLYTDISAEWIASDTTLQANWTTTSDSGVLTHQVQLVNQQIFKEVSDRAQCKLYPESKLFVLLKL